ncbi:hypothetical protein CSC70_04600 [Pseudoxanthomonas kalamensis DSM 18571]|nr:hypothetical protein CSC70_04600 [Pseudoxanthomonas kalamensis DSM 18571]
MVLSACASDRSKLVQANPAGQSQNSQVVTADQLYIARVEHIAKQRGVRVKWVNPPDQKQSN